MAKTVKYTSKVLIGEVYFENEISKRDFERLLKTAHDFIESKDLTITNNMIIEDEERCGYTYFYRERIVELENLFIYSYSFDCGAGYIALEKLECKEGKCFKSGNLYK